MKKAKASGIFTMIVGILCIILAIGMIAISVLFGMSGFNFDTGINSVFSVLKIIAILALLFLCVGFIIFSKINIKLAKSFLNYDYDRLSLEERNDALKNTGITYLGISILLVGFTIYALVIKLRSIVIIVSTIGVLFTLFAGIFVLIDYQKSKNIEETDCVKNNISSNEDEKKETNE